MPERKSARERLGYVDERDVDLVLVLDANCGGPLTAYIADKAGFEPVDDVHGARSTIRCGGTRETDVEIAWGSTTLLIENKVDASFTPGQPASYRSEVEDLRAVGRSAVAVLICPERNLARYRAAAEDVFLYITCEELADHAESSEDRLAHGAALVLRAAAEQRPGPASDPEAAAWMEAYRAVVASVTPPGESISFATKAVHTVTTEWVKLPMVGMPSGVDGAWHWFPRGLVSVYVYEEPDLATLPTGAAVVRNKKSWRVDLPASVVTMSRPARDQEEAIAEAVGAAIRLKAWCLNAR